MARCMRDYSRRESVTHGDPLAQAEAAVQKTIASDSLKVVIHPWGQQGQAATQSGPDASRIYRVDAGAPPRHGC